MDVNGEESRLSLIEAREDEELSSMEELNPDCYVVVYAVDDEQSFGEQFTIPGLGLHSPPRARQEVPPLADLEQQPGRQVLHTGQTSHRDK